MSYSEEGRGCITTLPFKELVMEYLLEGLSTALTLILSFDSEVMKCAFVSLQVSSIAVL